MTPMPGPAWIAVCATALLAPSAAPAQSPADSLGGLPPLTVRPSGIEDPEAEARARQERLLSRMQQNEYRFRAICTLCGTGASAPAPNAPFRPLETLAPPAKPAAE